MLLTTRMLFAAGAGNVELFSVETTALMSASHDDRVPHAVQRRKRVYARL
jgi:hypothetical protein